METNAHTSPSDPVPPQEEVLHSLKEIAAFLNVTVRSVQRWEKAGLPLHRTGGSKRGHVFAYRSELRQWLDGGGNNTIELLAEPELEPELEQEPESEAFDTKERSHFRTVVIAVSAVAILLVVSGLWVWRDRVLTGWSRIPASYRFERSRLTILDASDRICWTKQFPEFDRRFEPQVHDKVLIEDVDGDGRTEVLVQVLPEVGEGNPGSLQCFEQDGKLRWEFTYGGEKDFGDRHFDQFYVGNLIEVAHAGGRPVVLTVANHHIWYPSQVALIDVRTGTLVEEYWHPGAILQGFVRDFNHDGVDEFIFAGINNPGSGSGHAAMGVLSLPFSRAPRPEFAEGDPLRPLTGGGELSYVLFPTVDLAKAGALLPIPNEMSRRGEDRIFVELPLPEGSGVVYYLDFQLNVLEHRLSDNFVPLHEKYFRQKLLDHQLTRKEQDNISRVMHFRAAPNGNLDALDKLWTGDK